MIPPPRSHQRKPSASRDEAFHPSRSRRGKEGKRIADLLQTFDLTTSIAWAHVTQQFSSGIRHGELLSVANLIIDRFDIPRFSRDARRSYPVLVKWFDDNWGAISPVLPLVSTRDSEDHLIDAEREARERQTSQDMAMVARD